MDYEKSLFEIWKDVILFRNADRTTPQHDLLQFARFVEHLLGGPRIATTQDLTREIALQSDPTLSPDEQMILKVPACITGKIVHIGPTYKEMLSNLEKVDEWTATICDYFDDHDLRDAYEENDLFLQLLEKLEGEDLKHISQFERSISFYFSDAGEEAKAMFRILEMSQFSPQQPDMLKDCVGEMEAPVSAYSPEPRLFLLKSYGGFLVGKIGLAPEAAQKGDYICHFYEMEHALVLRQDSKYVRLVGTAVIVKDCAAFRKTKEDGMEEKGSRFGVPQNSSTSKKAKEINIYMDVATAYELSHLH